MPTPQEMQAQTDAWSQQYDTEAAQKAAQEAFSNGQQPQQTFLQRWTAPVGRVTSQLLDSAMSAADRLYDTEPMKKARDLAAGAITGYTNIADAVMSHAAGAIATAEHPGSDPERSASPDEPTTQEVYQAAEPIWEHAKQHIMDFRDAVAVQDPTLADNLVQGVGQLAIPFAGYSRALSGLHGVANMVAAGALTDATALQPHDMRMADLLALGRHTEGKLGEALRTLAPDGSAVNAYINYLTDRSNESEAEGRFKNVLDGFGANLIATPLIHGAAVVLKQGTAGLRYMVDNGVTSSSGLVPPSAQAGKIGVTPNGSGESAASAEAISRMKEEKKAGITRHVIREDDTVEPLIGPEAVDAKAYGRDLIVQMQGGEPTVLSRGPGMPEGHVQGRINRALANATLPGSTVTIGPQTVKKLKSGQVHEITSLKDLEK